MLCLIKSVTDSKRRAAVEKQQFSNMYIASSSFTHGIIPSLEKEEDKGDLDFFTASDVIQGDFSAP